MTKATFDIVPFRAEPEIIAAIDKLVGAVPTADFKMLTGMRSAVIRAAIIAYVRKRPRKLDLPVQRRERSRNGEAREKPPLVAIKADAETKAAFERAGKGRRGALVRAAVLEAAELLAQQG